MNPIRETRRRAWFLPSEDDDTFARRQLDLFADLIEAVGSADALWSLDVDPLPEEPIDESVIDPADLASWVLESGLPLRLQLQLHKLIWGPEARGV